MEKEELIKKWLDNNLNEAELKAFKQLDDAEDLLKINQTLQGFKAPEYNTSDELNAVMPNITAKQNTPKNWIKTAMKIAAIFTLCFGTYYYTNNLDTTITTLAAQKNTITLPDASTVNLNALSTVTYNENNWSSEREINLDGEAFFKVAKGQTFTVITDAGTVTVYGTQFNIKERDNYFEVACYEGLVGVTYNKKETKLHPGDHFLILNHKLVSVQKDKNTTPSWVNNTSVFKSLPYREVIAEFERQYNTSIVLEHINDAQLFTGSFTHNNIENALKSITLPLQLKHTTNNNIITLKRE
ncbi:FecR family protein [Lacinutrix undariae]